MNKVLMAMALSAAFVAIPASAAPASAAPYGYIGAGIGEAKTDSDNTSYKIFAGIQPTPNFGAELAYNDFGGYRGQTADSWSLAGTGTLPLDKNWDIFGKLGATRNHIKFGGSSDHTDLLAGVGIGYNFTPNVGVRLEYEDFGKLPAVGGNKTKVTNWGLNMKFSF